MREYLEDLWERLPLELTHPDLARRLDFLRSELQADDVALDVGCGDGTFTSVLALAASSAVGVDVAQAAVNRARSRHPELRFELTGLDGPLPFTDGEFTLVWASEVLEHVADTGAWLAEVRRVMAPGGRLLITTPSHGRLRLALGGIERFSEPLGDHLHLYSGRSLQGLLNNFHFTDCQVRAVAGPPLMRRLLLARAFR